MHVRACALRLHFAACTAPWFKAWNNLSIDRPHRGIFLHFFLARSFFYLFCSCVAFCSVIYPSILFSSLCFFLHLLISFLSFIFSFFLFGGVVWGNCICARNEHVSACVRVSACARECLISEKQASSVFLCPFLPFC